MLIGLPASGKTTYRNKFKATNPGYETLSTDDIIEDVAQVYGYKYEDVFESAMKLADKIFHDDFDILSNMGTDLILDRTHLSKKVRSGYLEQLKHYDVKAVVFDIDEGTRKERAASRGGKFIPEHIIDNMKSRYEEPTLDEGFSSIEWITE